MKMHPYYYLIVIVALLSCSSKEVKDVQKAQFGIYETIKVSELPDSLVQSLKTLHIQFEADTSLPVVGYVLTGYNLDTLASLLPEGIKVMKSNYTVDGAGRYYALAVIKKNPGIHNRDVRKAKAMNNNVEIHFTMSGAKKWADLIKNNQGRMMAFTIDDQVYSMPFINGEINNGSALINGINDEKVAKEIAESINASLTE